MVEASPPGPRRGVVTALALVCLAVATWSFIGAGDKPTWAFEVVPMALVLLLFAAARRRFAYTDLSMALVAVFFLIQCLGGRYTFAEVPFPQAISDLFGLERNPVDRIGHFMQGAVPAIVLREFLIRRRGLASSWTLFWLVTGCCLGFSGFYEILEMAVVLVFYPDAGPEWLGMQNDPWDAQWDMTMAFSGAMLAQLGLGRLLDSEIERMPCASPAAD